MGSESTFEVQTRGLIGFAVVTTLATFGIAYWISLDIHEVYWPWIFLSSSINKKPASCVGAFGLSLAVATLPFLSFSRYNHLESRLPKQRLNRVCLGAALICAVAGHGVASFQAHAHLIAHLSFACAFFVSGSVVSLTTSVLDARLSLLHTPRERFAANLRLLNSVLGLAALCTMGTCGALLATMGDDATDTSNNPRASHLQGMCAVAELVYFFCLLSVYATFFFELRGHVIVIVAKLPNHVDEDDKNEAGGTSLLSAGEREWSGEAHRAGYVN